MRVVVIGLLMLAACLIQPAQAAERVSPELAAAREALYAEDSAVIGADKDVLAEAINDLIIHELHRVQIAVERWSVDNSPFPPPELAVYPLSVNQLVHPLAEYESDRYIEPGFYMNPHGLAAPGEPTAMCVPLGWSELSPGNFSYLTQINEYTGEATGYIIVGYGPTEDSPFDLDGDGRPEGVIIILSSGNLDFNEPQTLYDSGREISWNPLTLDNAE